MAEQLVINNRYREEEQPGLNWSRIIGIAFVIALHVAAFLLLLIPAVAPPAEKEQEQKTAYEIGSPSRGLGDVYKRQVLGPTKRRHHYFGDPQPIPARGCRAYTCLLYTSDAADE